MEEMLYSCKIKNNVIEVDHYFGALGSIYITVDYIKLKGKLYS